MFSPAAKKPHYSSQKDRNLTHGGPDSPATPLTENRKSPHGNSVPNRPSTGTPAPWTSRLSVLARISPAKKTEESDADTVKPVYVGEFPAEVRDAQAKFLQKSVPSYAGIFGGMDKGTSLSWVICGNQLFVWSYLSPAASKSCIILELPSSVLDKGDISTGPYNSNTWLVSIVDWDGGCTMDKVANQKSSAGIIVCNQKTQAVIYWPEIYSEHINSPVVSLLSSDRSEGTYSPGDGKTPPNNQRRRSRLGNTSLAEPGCFNSFIASAIPAHRHACVALASSSSGELWQFRCNSSGIFRKRIFDNLNTFSTQNSDGGHSLVGKGYPRSLIWQFLALSLEKSYRQFFLLTDREIQCFRISFDSDLIVSKLWSHEIIGTDSDLGIKKDLAGQKRVWPLDMQVDVRGKELTVLVATFCKDRVSSSSYTQYSLLTMQYRAGISIYLDNIDPMHERMLEKKSPIQVIIPKARVEDEDFLFNMRLRVGGKPSGSTIILSGDGTATVSHYWRNATRLYQFDLLWDAGKVLDASVFPSAEDGDEGAWVVLTEKAGVWAIPEKAVLLGGVEPPERSLSRKGSSNEGATEEEKRNMQFGGGVAPRRVSSEAWDVGDRQRAGLTRNTHRTAQDEESEALLGRLFHDFLSSGQIDGSLAKLNNFGAFEKDDETNVFARVSKSIVDTLAKHWTTTRGAEFVALTAVSNQLSDKQQKHQKYLQFLALSKCHEELSAKQRCSLQTIMEHGEKLAAIIQVRELQNTVSNKRLSGTVSSYSDSQNEISGSLWDLIQLVGEKARRNTILLMDRDNAEVFYSKVTDLEEVFNCLSHQLQYLTGEEQPLVVQIQRACELSNVCTSLIYAALGYKNEHNTWYPSPEGLLPWYCQSVVRDGLWCVASLMLQLSKEVTSSNGKSDLYSHLEELTSALLETYNGAITTKLERGEEHSSLLDEYSKRRDALLDSLYQQVKGFVEDKYQHPNDSTEEPKDVLLKNYSSSLLSIARHHEGYQTLWSICCDLSDTVLLRNFMHESVGPRGGFCYFVFKQLYKNHHFSKLLRLGEEFPEELAIFLKEHRHLSWLHETFLNNFSAVSENLHVLALSQDDNSASTSEEGSDRGNMEGEPSLADRKRLLNLSKIAAMAGRDIEFPLKTRRIEADLKLMKLQEEIIGILSENKEKQDIRRGLLPPVELIELCLKGNTPKLSLLAFDVFAWTTLSFCSANRGLLEECWKSAADQDDWGRLYQVSIAQGWSDDETFQNLQKTVLFQASNRCYGSVAESYEGGFDEVLPLKQEDAQSSTLQDTSSVEGILMQHKSFPDAGKLMLSAIMFGRLEYEGTVEEQIYTPME